jgi:PEP-CTERM motif
MKWVMGILCGVVACAASASSLAVSGGGFVGQPHFFMNGDNFAVNFGLPGVHSVIGCNLDTPCELTGISGSPSIGIGNNTAFFQGQSGFIQGTAIVTDASIVFPTDWQNIPGFIGITPTGQPGPVVPAFITANVTGLQVPFFPSLDGSHPFFTASISGAGTVGLEGCGNVATGIVRCENAIFEFSGTAEVTAVSGSEVPEPGSLLLVAGALACGIAFSGRRLPV